MEKKKIKCYVFQNSLLKRLLTTTQATAQEVVLLPPVKRFPWIGDPNIKLVWYIQITKLLDSWLVWISDFEIFNFCLDFEWPPKSSLKAGFQMVGQVPWPFNIRTLKVWISDYCVLYVIRGEITKRYLKNMGLCQ